MICPTCTQPTTRLIIDSRGKACANCRGLSENAGTRLSGVLTRNSDRVRAQQQQHEGDTILPHKFDKTTQSHVPNPDFVDRYAEQLPTYFTREEMQKAGYSKADKIFEHKKKKQTLHDSEASQVTFKKDVGDEKLKQVIRET